MAAPRSTRTPACGDRDIPRASSALQLPRAAQFLDELLIRVRADQGLQFIELDAVGDTLWDFVSDCAKQSITGVGRCGALSGLSSTRSGTCSAIGAPGVVHAARRSEEHTSELQSLKRLSYA